MKKKSSTKQTEIAAEMRPDYDFTGGVRGKHHQVLQEGYTIKIHKTDGTIIEKRVGMGNTVTLEPDVRAYFPTSKAVNHALRTFISIAPPKRKAAAQKAHIDKDRRKLVTKSRAKRSR